MSWFGRRRREAQEPVEVDETDDAPVEFVDDLDEEDRAHEDALLLAEIEAAEAERERESRRLVRPSGPWDLEDLPADDDTPRVDLGSLRVPLVVGAEVRLDVDPEGQITSATLVVPTGSGSGSGAVQLSAFAAPRSEGIWSEVLDEIEQSLTSGSGSAERVDGPFGPEVRATLPTQTASGIAMSTVRFAGVDGPRWLLRAVFSGTAATDPAAAASLEQAVRGVVVVRGGDPMAVRDTLPLRVPEEAAAPEPGDDEEPEGGEDHPSLELPERGPEITETR